MPSLKPYPAYTDTDLPWLPKIPKHWDFRRFRYLFDESKEINGNYPVGEMLSVSSYDGIIPKVYEYDEQKRSLEDLYTYRVVKPGQLVVNTMWLNYGGLGVSDYEGHVSPAYEVYDLSNDVDKKYIHHLLRSLAYINLYKQYLYGIRPNSYQIKTNDFISIPILIPPLEEQRTIAAYLDRQTAKIDALIAKKQRLLDLLAEQRAALISQAVTKGLNPAVKMKDSGVAWLGQVPSHWEVKRNKYLFREQTARSETGRETLLMVHQKLGIVPRQDYMDDRPVIADSLIGYKVCHEDDLVLNKLKGHLGVFYRATAHGIVSPDYTVFKKISNIHTKYYEYLFRYTSYVSEFKRISKGVGSGFLRLYTGEFNEVPALIPPYQEQAQIVEYIDNESVRLADLGKKIETAIERLQEYRAALISSVVTGKVDVRNFS